MSIRQVFPARQLALFGGSLAIYLIVIFITYTFIPMEQLTMGLATPVPPTTLPGWLLGLANTGLVLVVYGLAGLAGGWFAHRLGIPWMLRTGATRATWLLWPLGIGAIVGLFIATVDLLAAQLAGLPRLVHPTFPHSLLASLAAGIGEELMFRSFVMGLWALLIGLVVRRPAPNGVALWIAAVIAAIAFAAGHLPIAMMMVGVDTPAALPGSLLAEIFLLNGVLSLVAAAVAMRDGLLPAMAIHFWADVVWHVIYPLM